MVGALGTAGNVVLVLHILSAALGFGAILVTGVYAGLARRAGDGWAAQSVRRYFSAGTNWVARALYLVPVLGVALVALSNGEDRFSQPWLFVSLVLWVLAAGLAQGVVWPGERRIQATLSGAGAASRRDPGQPRRDDLDRACRRVERAALVIDVLFVAGVVLMLARPGGGG